MTASLSPSACQTGNDRSEKIFLVIMYIAKLDPEFTGIEEPAIGSKDLSGMGFLLSLDISSTTTKIIAGKKEYGIVFKSYKHIFFPVRLVINKKH